MRREDFAARAAHALRRICARAEPTNDRNIPVLAVAALIVGLLLSVTLLAATESGVSASHHPAIQHDALHNDSPLDESLHVSADGEGQDPQVDAGASVEQETEAEIRWFNNRPIRPVKTVTMTVTAYSPDERSCGDWADGFTASGYSVWTNGMKLVAADTSILPFGSLVSVPGYDEGDVVPVLDRGGAIKGNRLDVLYPTHESALEWGVQSLEVTIWEYADGQPNGFRQQHHRR